jgi:hypothetical protein
MDPVLKTPFKSCHRFFGMELKHTKCFLRLSCHFTAMSTVALLVVLSGVT